ncbi:PAS domain S-box protein [Anabaena sp. CCY 9614]|uniref:PAS domain S-box protein n=2 Tax=unclassified Anabaena TaxID=2619674 RepID=UPI0039C60B21
MKIDELTMRFKNQLIYMPDLYHVIDHCPLTISPDSYVVDAIVLMNQERSHNYSLIDQHYSLNKQIFQHQDTSYVLVVEKKNLLGIFTAKDVIKVIANGINISQVKIAEVMVQPVITLTTSHSQNIFTAWTLLRQHQVRYLPILNEGRQLVGIVTETSLLNALDLSKMLGMINPLQQDLQYPTHELGQVNQQLHQVCSQTPNESPCCLDAELAEIVQANQKLQQILAEFQVERTSELLVANNLLQQEINERQRAEEALRQSEQLYRQLVETQADVIIRVDLHGQITFANTAACQTFGWQIDEFRHSSLFDFTYADDVAEVKQNLTDLLSPPYQLTINERRVATVEGLRWFQWHVTAVQDDTGKVVEIQGLGRDITERRQIELSLQKSEEKFRRIAENTQAVIWMSTTDLEKNLYVNPAYEKIWGRAYQSLIDQPDSWLEAVHPDDRHRVRAKIQRLKQGESADVEYRISRPDGSLRWIWDRGFAIYNQQGHVEYNAGIAEDITERKQIEESLQESEARLSLALEASHMGMWDWNLISNELVCSSNLGNIYGLPSGDCSHSMAELLNLVHPEDREYLTAAVASSIEQGNQLNSEFRIIKSDGSVRWLSQKGKVFNNEIGQPTRMIGTTRDICERKQAELALRDSEERYRSVVTAMSEGIVVHEANGKIIACNPSAERILGLFSEQIFGRICTDPRWHTIKEDGSPFPGETHPAMVTLRTGQPCSNVVMGVHQPHGQLVWISINSQPLFRDNEPTPYAVIASFSDISQRKHAENKIFEQAALLDIATDAILVRDFQSQISYWNQGAERLYGWLAEEALGKDVQHLMFKKTSPQLKAALKTVTESGSWQGELRKVTKSGQEVIVESRWTLMRDAAGQPKAILSVDTDITQKKQLEEQFFRAQRLESLGTLAGGIAHDLNNILTPILAASQLLQVRFAQDQEQSQRLLAIIEKNARRGADLVKQVLSFARGFKGERTILQIKHLIAEITLIAKQTFPRSIEFVLSIPEDLWAISGDVTQLHQVLMNLVVNARDAMPDGGKLTISAQNIFIDEAYTRMHLDAKVGDYIMLTVADTGMGMSPATLDRIFEPFFTTKEIGTGTGLGLSTVLGIVKSHGGFVSVSSKIEQGSKFKLFLPAVAATPSLETKNLETFPGQGELILVVDDEAQIQEIAKIILEKHNYRTLIASNGIEAIALYAQHKKHISAVLMDIMMPEMDGITAIRTLQKMNPQVQIIACSGINPNEALEMADNTQVQRVISKPYTAQDLLHSLNHLLRLN